MAGSVLRCIASAASRFDAMDSQRYSAFFGGGSKLNDDDLTNAITLWDECLDDIFGRDKECEKREALEDRLSEMIEVKSHAAMQAGISLGIRMILEALSYVP